MEITAAALAAELCGASQEDPLLAVLCEAAEAAWESRLDPGVTMEDCGGALRCAAAFMAAADYMGKRCRAESFTVGEGTVRQSGGQSAGVMAETLRQFPSKSEYSPSDFPDILSAALWRGGVRTLSAVRCGAF